MDTSGVVGPILAGAVGGTMAGYQRYLTELSETARQANRKVTAQQTWTVIGFWLNEDPVVAVTVKGSVEYYRGNALDDNMDNDLKGGWGETVEAPDAGTAAAQAISRMLRTLDENEEEK